MRSPKVRERGKILGRGSQPSYQLEGLRIAVSSLSGGPICDHEHQCVSYKNSISNFLYLQTYRDQLKPYHLT